MLPLGAAVSSGILGYFSHRVFPKRGALPGILANSGSLALSIWLFYLVSQGQYFSNTYFSTEFTSSLLKTGTTEYTFQIGLLVDQLAVLMLVIVSLLALLTHIFSLEYWKQKPEASLPLRYTSLNLITFSVLAVLTVDNLLMAFLFFELAGLSSFLLIKSNFQDLNRAIGQKRGMFISRFGDLVFLISVIAILATFGTTSFIGRAFPRMAEQALAAARGGGVMPETVNRTLEVVGMGPEMWFVTLGLLTFGGILGSVCQPLLLLRKDKLSSIFYIHVGIMMATGVYLLLRMYGFYAMLPIPLAVITLVGGIGALLAAIRAVIKTDLNQVLGYAVISQFGFILVGIGSGGYQSTVYHLVIVSVVAPLLFFAAGVIQITDGGNSQITAVGNIRKDNAIIYCFFIVGFLVISGVAPIFGYWSQIGILNYAHSYATSQSGLPGLLLWTGFVSGLITIFYTSFYIFRMAIVAHHPNSSDGNKYNGEGAGRGSKFTVGVLGLSAILLGILHIDVTLRLFGQNTNIIPVPGPPIYVWTNPWGDITSRFQVFTFTYYHDLLFKYAGHRDSRSTILIFGISLFFGLSGAGTAWRRYGLTSTGVPDVHEPTQSTEGKYRWLLQGVYIPFRRLEPNESVCSKPESGKSTIDQLVEQAENRRDAAEESADSGEYETAINRYQSAIDKLETVQSHLEEDSEQKEQIKSMRDAAESALESIQSFADARTKVREDLQNAEEDLQTAITAHAAGKTTLANTRYRNAEQAYDRALETVSAAVQQGHELFDEESIPVTRNTSEIDPPVDIDTLPDFGDGQTLLDLGVDSASEFNSADVATRSQLADIYKMIGSAWWTNSVTTSFNSRDEIASRRTIAQKGGKKT